MNKFLVSAVITTYKRKVEHLKKAIESVLKQTYDNIEILVIDDNEKDSIYSVEIQNEIEWNERLIYISCNGNKGACYARNLGIKNAKGYYIGFLDDDDEWKKDKIQMQVDAFSDGVGLVSVRGTVYNCDTNIQTPYFANVPCKEYVTTSDLLQQDYIGSTSQPLLLKEALVRCGGFTVGLPARQDYDMWIRISKEYKIRCLDEDLFIYNRHSGDQITKHPEKAMAGYEYIYKTNKKELQELPSAKDDILSKIMWYAKQCSWITYLKYTLIRIPYQIIKKSGNIYGKRTGKNTQK
jgi:glycosyltransferase involved in cell wall biosynthesis